MTVDEKIGQVFIAGAYPNQADALSEGQTEPCIEYIERMIKDYHIGGVIFKFFWDPLQEAQLVKHFQSQSKIPLFAAQDLEWGLTMRMPSALRYPKNMTLGAIQNDQLIYDLGREIGKQCKVIGINFNFAPVMDINCNPDNPVINDRSFGCDKDNVARKGTMFILGLQSEGIAACAKHFPGHGDTSVDSHFALPVINHNRERLDNLELYPFQEAINAGVHSIMSAHLYVPSLDPIDNRPASLSKTILKETLRKELHFQGVIVTDDLLMKAVSQDREPGQLALEAFVAGNDVLISSRGIAEGFAAIKAAIEDGRISIAELDARVLRILKEKQWMLHKGTLENETSFSELDWESLATPSAKNLKKALYQQATTLLHNKEGLVPLKDAAQCSYIQIGGKGNGPFYNTLKGDKALPIHYLPFQSSKAQQEIIIESAKNSDLVVIALFDMNKFSKQNWGISDQTIQFYQGLLSTRKNIILVLFGNPYSLKLFESSHPIIVAYEDDPDAQTAAAEAILGKIPALGKLPIQIILPSKE